jgi:hypothetical protein
MTRVQLEKGVGRIFPTSGVDLEPIEGREEGLHA